MSANPQAVPPPPPPPSKPSSAPSSVKATPKKRGPYKKKTKSPEPEPPPGTPPPVMTPEQVEQLAALHNRTAMAIGGLAGIACEVFLRKRAQPDDMLLVGQASLDVFAAWFPEMSEKERSLLLLAAALGGMVSNAQPLALPQPESRPAPAA
jgi:hypothetical protein